MLTQRQGLIATFSVLEGKIRFSEFTVVQHLILNERIISEFVKKYNTSVCLFSNVFEHLKEFLLALFRNID